MKKLSCKLLTILLSLCFESALARDYVIYSVAQDLPMGEENEVIRKNFYVNIGQNQGVTRGTVLDVYRTIAKQNAYESKRVSYKVKIGEVEVLHSTENASIGISKKLLLDKKSPIFSINNFMIGDNVSVSVKK